MSEDVQGTPGIGDAPITAEATLTGIFEQDIALDNPPEVQDAETIEDQPQDAPESVEPGAQESEEAVEAEAETEAEEAAESDDPDTDPQDDPETVEAPAIEAPSGMSEADKAIFAQLPPEQQAWVSRRETDRTADYTRKTQELADRRKETDATFQVLGGAMQQYDAVLQKITGQELTPPDKALEESDPYEYDRQWRQYQEAKDTQQRAVQEQAENAQRFQALQNEQARQYLSQQNAALSELSPELADQGTKGAQLRKSVKQYALKNGYTEEQLGMASAQDSVTLLKAMRYDASQAARSKVRPANPTPKASRPGKGKSPGRPTNFAKSVQTLKAKKNPTVDDLTAAYLADIQSER